MAETRPRKFWRISRKIFRWVRVAFLFAFFLVVFSVVYLHEIGVPDFIKRPVLQRIRHAGFDVEFSNMRWAWPNLIRIENPRFSQTNDSAVQISASALDFEVNTGEAAEKHLRFDSILLTKGQIVLPLARTNKEILVLTNIAAAVRVSTNQTLHIDKLGGQFDGANVEISGSLANYTALLDWNFPSSPKSPTPKPGQNPLQGFISTWRKFKFSTPPNLSIKFSGNGADTNSLKLDALLLAPSLTQTPWGKTSNLRMRAACALRSQAVDEQLAIVSASTDLLETPNGSANKAKIDLSLFAVTNNLWRTDLALTSSDISFHWVAADTTNSVRGKDFRWKGNLTYTTNVLPDSFVGHFDLSAIETTWGKAQTATATVDSSRNNSQFTPNSSLGFWEPLTEWKADWNLQTTDVKAPNLELQQATCKGNWSAPRLSIQELNAKLYDGSIKVRGDLDIATRDAKANLISDFDGKKMLPLLPERAQHWLKKFNWEKPPKISAAARATLPSWTNRQPDWQGEVVPTVQVSGKVSLENGSYRDVPVLATTTDFAFSNMTWEIPNLHVSRPEGAVDLSLKFNKKTRENHWLIDSSINPKAIKPWFPDETQTTFDKVQLGGPPTIHAEILERGFNFSNCVVKADIVATNVAYREVALDRLKTSLTFTNHLLSFSGIRLEQGDRLVTAPNAEIDLDAKRVYLHELYSTMDPYAVTRSIGRKVAEAIEPYQFHKIPTVYVDGNFVVDNPEDADLHFLVEGEDFEWSLLRADKAAAKVDWIGPKLSVTNITAQGYRNGNIDGWVYVDFLAEPGADFKVGMSLTNIDLHSLMLGLGKTNQLEGTLDGKINLTANTEDRAHWNGFGWVQLHDGLIWEVPIFGIFSPVLNTVVPGSGNSRAREALATFVITNSVIRSDDLEIHSLAVRINYRGTVDFHQRVDAKVEAQIFRDAGSIGHLFSILVQPITKIFEYKLTGTLDNPKSEPVFIPSFIMKILRPINTLKQMLPAPSNETPSEKPQVSQ